MPTRTVQTKYLNQWCVRRTPLAWTTTAMSSGLSHVMVLVILTLGLGSCAARMHSPADISGLRADLNAHAETLAQIAARVETLERRQSLPGSASGQTPQDLTQAIEVLLKKALLTESRLTALESSTPPPRAPEKSAKQTRHPTPDGKEAVGQQHGDQHGSPRLTQPSPPPPTVASSAAKLMRLGMSSAEVRRALGDPISTETAGSYIFWQYSQVDHQKYVIFEKSTGQVSGWWGL